MFFTSTINHAHKPPKQLNNKPSTITADALKKNILIVCTSPALGGLELYAEREWHNLNQHPDHKCYFALSASGKLMQRLKQQYDTKQLPIHASKLFPLFAAIKMARYIDRHAIDIIHMHWGNDLHLCALAKIISKTKPVLIYSRHMRITRPKKDFFHRFFYRQVNTVLAVSRCVLNDAHLFLPLDKSQSQLLHPGVAAPTKVTNNCPAHLSEHKPEGGFYIGMFGRIEHGKGQHLLIDAVASLLHDGTHVTAYIIGHPMDHAYFSSLKKRVQEEKLDNNIVFMDFVDNPSQILPCFDVITLLTYCETFGLILAEAMRANVCVIGTNAGGVPDIIDNEKTGLLIEAGDANMLAHAIKRLHDNPELKNSLAHAGKIKADRCFNEENHFSKLRDIIAQL